MKKGTGRGTLLAGASLLVLTAGLAAPSAPSAAQCTAGAINASCTNAASIGSVTIGATRAIGSLTNTGSGTITNTGTITVNITTVVAGATNNGTIGTLSNIGSIGAVGTVTVNDTNTSNNNLYYKAVAGVANIGTISLFDNSGTITGKLTVFPTNGGFDNFHNRIAGVFNAGSITNFINESGAVIDGALVGVDNWITGTINTLTNLGTISSSNRTGFMNEGQINTLTNTGLIKGIASGIWAASGTINTLTNSGTISVGQEAVTLSPGAAIGTIANQAGGTIVGGSTGINNAGSIGRITNSGTIAGVFEGVTNNDVGVITTIANTSSGVISATTTAILNRGTIGTITNNGTIGGIATRGIDNTGTIAALINTGLINGSNYAIVNEATGTLGIITNSGTIAGDIANLSSRDLTINGGSGNTIGTLTGSSGGLGTADRGLITIGNTLTNLVLASGNQLLNDNVIGNVMAGGNISLVNPITITGNYAQTAGGLIINAPSGTTGYGYLTVTGNAGVSNTAITISGTGLISGEQFTIVRAGGTGSYANDTATVIGGSGLTAEIITTIGNNLVIDLVGCSGTIGASCVNTTTIGSIVVPNATSIGSFTNNSIINGGSIGVLVQGTIGSFNNSGTISISGRNSNASYAVNVAGSIGTLTNSGAILGDTPLSVSGTVGTLVNSGTMGAIGDTDGVFVRGHIGTLTNTGTIIGWNGTGIINNLNNGVFVSSGSIGTLNNAAGGTILGVTGVLNENGTIASLINAGTIAGTITGTLSPGDGIGIDISGAGATIGSINNSGLITAPVSAFTISGGGSVGSFTNSGTIAGNIGNSGANALTINGGTGSTFGTLTGYAGAIGTITSTGGNVVLGSGNQVLNDNVNVGSHSLIAAGTIALVNPIAVTGNYAQNSGGMVIDVTNGTLGYGYLNVSGNATVSNTAITIAGTGLAAGESFTIVRPGGATDVYANDTFALSGAFGLTATSSIVGNSLVVTLSGGGASTTITNPSIVGAGAGGTLSGGTKVALNVGSTITAVINTGTIGGTGTVGGGTVTGNNGAVANRGVVLNFANSGTITGQGGATSSGVGLYSGAGNSVAIISNSAGGIVSGSTAAIQNVGGVGTLTNAGTVTSKAPTGIVNLAGGTIGTLSNTGTISGTGAGIASAGTIGQLANAAGALISGTGVALKNSGAIGTITNAGAILDAAAGTLNSVIGGVANQGTIVTLTNSGLISGTGGATVAGVGLQNDAGATVEALSNVAGGTIGGNSAGVQNQGGITALNNAGTITSAAPTGLANSGVIGTISNTGTIAGTSLALSNTGTIDLIDDQGVIGAVSNSGLIKGLQVGFAGSIGPITNSGTIDGFIANNGAAALTINGASTGFGTLTGGGITSTAGLIMNSGNQLLLENVNVGSGTFSVTGGRLSLVRQQNVTGNFLQTGGSLLVNVSESSYGSLAVSGTATVTNSVIELSTTSFRPGEKLAIVSAAAGGTYTGDTLNWVNAIGTLSPVLLVTADTLYITLPGYQQIGRTVDQIGGAMGATLDRLGAETNRPAFMDALDALPGTAMGEGIRQLAPTQIPATEIISSGASLAMGVIADHQQTAADAPHHTAIWGQMLNGGASRNTADDAEGYRSSSFGFSTGVETMLTSNDTAGAAFSWIRGWAGGNAVASGQSLSADSYFITLYDGLRLGQAYIDAQASVGLNSLSERRGIGFLGATASANYDGRTYLARLGAGYDLDLGQLGLDGVTLSPIAGFTALRVESPSYTETGAGAADLFVASNGVNEVTHDIGAKVTWTMPTPIGALSPMLKAEWLHDYNHGPILTSGVLGDQGFVVGTARPGQDGARFGYGLTLDNSRDLSIKIEGQSDLRPDYQAHSATLRVIVGF